MSPMIMILAFMQKKEEKNMAQLRISIKYQKKVSS